jgi:hypothetical protein
MKSKDMETPFMKSAKADFIFEDFWDYRLNALKHQEPKPLD